MYRKIVYLMSLWCSVAAYNYQCSLKTALALQKRPIYEFSIKLLQRVSEDTQTHFVFSPLSTWLQVSALAEGASGATYDQIMNVTKLHPKRCYRRKLRSVFEKIRNSTKYQNKNKNIIIIDELMAVKEAYVKQVEKMGLKVMLLDFSNKLKSSEQVNQETETGTRGHIDYILFPSDFELTNLLLSDANYFHIDWASAFDPAYTKIKDFFSSEGNKIGEVNMMNKVDYFNMLEIKHIGAQVLEIPCSNSYNKISALIFLPTQNYISELFFTLERTNLNSIFNLYKRHNMPKLVNVSIPRFNQRTESDNLSELLYDMGLHMIFDRSRVPFKRISDFKIAVSLVTQISEINFNEYGVTVQSPEPMVQARDILHFNANKPFAYMIVEKKTDFILYAGVYSNPSAVS